MTIVLSHRIARLFHRAPGRPEAPASLPTRAAPLRCAAPSAADAERARALLASYGVPPGELDRIDVLVGDQTCERRMPGVAFHVWGRPLPARALLRLDAGVFVADAELCALQAASYLDELPLVEYLFELCGGYELPFDTGRDYRETPPATSAESLERFFSACAGAHGVKRARRMLGYTRDGARSPMETALVLTIVLPRSLGGLGVRDLVMDHPVNVARCARNLTRRSMFYLDAFIERGRQDLEYNGLLHRTDENEAIDGERARALAAMGYNVVTVTKGAFFNPFAFRRVLASICRNAGIRTDRFPEDFPARQEALRRFVLRRFLEGGTSNSAL